MVWTQRPIGSDIVIDTLEASFFLNIVVTPPGWRLEVLSSLQLEKLVEYGKVSPQRLFLKMDFA